MKPTFLTARGWATLFVLPAVLFLAACDSNPVDDDDHDDHADEIEGIAVMMNGAEVWRVLEGEVTCATAQCGFAISAGEETPLISVEFLGHEGEEIHSEDLGAEFSLGHAFATEGIAEFEQHSEDGKWAFHLHGESAGTTGFQLRLLHNDHADFTTPPVSASNAIQITVQ
ncbi:MAG: hypothetical protein JJ896_11865 [Rhodothermales bacterium]|nr:hypothetical protein [Rhodothermales bacterium]MBO6780341.1 hypothetical protein [Rhodothermales bacterium]